MLASLLPRVVTIALVIGVIVSCTATLVMVFGVTTSRPGRRSTRQVVHPAPAIARPGAMLDAARARARRAAEHERSPVGHRGAVIDVAAHSEPVAARPAGRPAARPAGRPAGRTTADRDGPGGAAPATVDEVRAAIDHLVETNPGLLAEVITQWIRNDTPPAPRHASQPTSSQPTSSQPTSSQPVRGPERRH